MRDRIYHRGHREEFWVAKRLSRRPLRLCALCVKAFFLTLLITSALTAQTPKPQQPRNHYQIQLTLDYENRTYTGVERVRWVNRGDHSTSTLFFHLYPNVRMAGYVPPPQKPGAATDEPRLEISEVRTVANNSPVQFTLD